MTSVFDLRTWLKIVSRKTSVPNVSVRGHFVRKLYREMQTYRTDCITWTGKVVVKKTRIPELFETRIGHGQIAWITLQDRPNRDAPLPPYSFTPSCNLVNVHVFARPQIKCVRRRDVDVMTLKRHKFTVFTSGGDSRILWLTIRLIETFSGCKPLKWTSFKRCLVIQVCSVDNQPQMITNTWCLSLTVSRCSGRETYSYFVLIVHFIYFLFISINKSSNRKKRAHIFLPSPSL